MMKIPIVKEWGSWAVLFTSCAAGLIAGLMRLPDETGRDYAIATIMTILGFTFIINSKNPLNSFLRLKWQNKEHLLWFIFFSLAGITLLIPFLSGGFRTFSVFILPVISYFILLSKGKEHNIFTELNGFALLTVSAPAVYFAVSGEMSWRLYIAVTIFFAAGVFKVRVRMRKTLLLRWLMALYCLSAVLIYALLGIPVILLLPLVENILTVIRMQEERLKTTGYTELTKGLAFILLIALSWR